MCGRVQLDLELNSLAMQRLCDLLAKEFPDNTIKSGEKYPSDLLPIFTRGDDKPKLHLMNWGFPFPGSKKLVINARSETAATKPMFKKSMEQYRCIIPTTGFYEWTHDREKIKYLFRLSQEPILYLAGLYRRYDDKERFVILTQGANDSIIDVHGRMPVIIPEKQIRAWLNDKSAADAMLADSGANLIRYAI